MKKIKSIMCLLMALTILCGSTLTAFATETTESSSNYVSVRSGYKHKDWDSWCYRDVVLESPDEDIELCAVESDILSGEVVGRSISFYVIGWEEGQFSGGTDFAHYCPYVQCTLTDESGNVSDTTATGLYKEYYTEDYEVTYTVVSGSYKLFETKDELFAYAVDRTGEYIEITPPTLNSELYFKNVGYSVRAEDSSEYPDLTYIKFTWDTDNLQAGDMLEIMTRNHYTKIGGDQVIGFHQYMSASQGVDCSIGSYEMSQTDAVKAWFETVENKPLVFKDYDTDIYYLRPVRGSEYGMWVKVTMGRKTPTSSPFVSDIEYGTMTDEGDWMIDENVTVSQGGSHGIDQNGDIIASDDVENIVQLETIGDWIKYLVSCVTELFGYFGELPLLINTVVGWLPNPIIAIICGSIVVVILLRVFGR